MAANKTVYTLDLDSTGLVQGYKRALKEMENAGYSVQVTGNISKELDKLIKDYDILKKQAQNGFTNPKEIAAFNDSMNKLIGKFGKLDTLIGAAGTDLKQMVDRIKLSVSGLSDIFTKAGFSNVKKITDDIVAATNKNEVAEKALNEELKTRVERLKAIQAEQQKLKGQQSAAVANVLTGVGTNKAGKAMQLFGTNQGISDAQKAEDRAKILAKAQQLAATSKSIQQIWQQLNAYIVENGLGPELSSQGEKAKQLKEQLQQAKDAAAQYAEQISEARKNAKAGKDSVEAIGSIDKESGEYKVKTSVLTDTRRAIKEVEKDYSDLGKVMQNPRASADELNRAMETSNRVMTETSENSRRARTSFDEMINPIAKAATQASNMAKSIENLRQRILFLFSATSIFYKIRAELNKTFESVKQLDKSFASIAMVTDKTLSDMWSQYDKYADMATKLGQSTNDMIQASALFYQQGLDTNEALQLTTDTMKLATLAGSDFSTATKEMTSTIHGFNMAMNEGSHITDVYSELAAHAAASVDEIAKAMERTASIANSAGMSFENTSVFLTHMLETTQEGAENIGTSLKTIIARFGELKNNVSATESEFDDLDLNKVDKALKSVGVQLKDETLQFRDLDQVLLELSSKWSSLDRNTQRYIATIAAGSRQQSRFLALMDGYDRTVELMETAAEAEGKADQQFAKYADTVEYRLKQLQTKWEEFKVSITNSDLWKGMLTTASSLLDRLNNVDTKRLVVGGVMGVIIGKQLISALTSQIASSAQTVSNAFNNVTKKIINDFNNKTGSLGEKAIAKQINNLKAKINSLTADFGANFGNNLNPALFTSTSEAIKILSVDIAGLTNPVVILNTLLGEEVYSMGQEREALKALHAMFPNLSQDTSEFTTQLGHMSEAAQNTTNKINSAAQGIKSLSNTEEIAKQQSVALGSALGAAFGSISIALTGIISGTTSTEEAFRAMTMTSVMMLTTNLIPAISAIATAIKTAENAWVAFTTSSAAMTGGISAALLIIGLIGTEVAKQVKFAKENSPESQLKRINELLEKQSELIAEANSKAKEARKTYDNVEELKKRYEELHNRIVLTEDEQEEYNKIVEQIVNEFPELVDSYNTITNELTVQSEKWDEILKKQKESKAIAEGNAIATGLQKYSLEQGKINTERERINSVGYVDPMNGDYSQLLNKLLNVSAETTYAQVFENDNIPLEVRNYVKNWAKQWNIDTTGQIGAWTAVSQEVGKQIQGLYNAYLDKASRELEQEEAKVRAQNIGQALGVSQLTAAVLNGQITEKAGSVDYRGLNEDALAFLKENNEDLYNKIYDSEKNEFKEGFFGGAVKLTNDEKFQIFEAEKNQSIGQMVAENWEKESEAIKQKLEDLGANWKNYDEKELDNIIKTLDQDTQELIRNHIKEQSKEVTDKLNTLGIKYQKTDSFVDTENVLKSYQNLLKKFDYDEGRTRNYLNLIRGSGNVLAAYQNLDWGQVTADNYYKTKETFINSFGTEAEQEEAGRLWAQNFSLGFKNGLADNLIPTTEGGALAIQEIAESGIDTIAEDFGKILPAIEGQLKKGSLNNTQFKAVKESLLNVGLNPEDYLNYNSRSIKNIEDLIQKYKDLGAAKVNYIQISIDAARAEGRDTTALEKSLEQAKSYWQGMANYFDEQYQNAIPEETDAEKATKNYEKALKDLAKAQEDVADKQKDLNDKIKAYNDLLNGSENRKSSLDNLYNYNEALSSFNDELSRAKDIVEDANTIDSAIDAMSRYGAATKQLITEEKAKQEAIKDGLNNYGNMIENGTYAYTNSQTGETTNINFGSYARKDSRTGKYMLDQRLLNEARFGDKFKDLIEQQVSEYNKYADELLKSEDNVRKAEKDIQKEREDALKKYVALETQLAEALKKQYEDEVNDQKSKYDDLKKQDDDYLDALKDAIDKQKKLREQENKWEELAQQEKKLSLMRRDTSGANAKEVASLEKEVAQSREEMLNDAIDNVVDNLEKLYESQEELRNEEMELKEAIVDNTAYWNAKAESMIQSFDNAEEYAQYISSISKEYADMTLAMQQEKLAEYANTYEEATEYMALQAMDAATETGDYIVEMTTITGQEVTNIVNQTGEAFTQEVIRQFNETTNAFTEDMRKAAEAIDAANKALQDAYEKLADCAKEADSLASKLGGEGGGSNNPPPETPGLGGDLIQEQSSPSSLAILMARAMNSGNETDAKNLIQALSGNPYSGAFTAPLIKKLLGEENLPEELKNKFLINTANMTAVPTGGENYYIEIASRLNKKYGLAGFKKYADGGLVNYTGPAWVDGSHSKPEAFLSAEDTARIGEAAKILADLPWLGSNPTQNITNNRGGDVAVEINLNIDKLASDVDVDNMIERVKQEIVEVSRPIGSPTILQQN